MKILKKYNETMFVKIKITKKNIKKETLNQII